MNFENMLRTAKLKFYLINSICDEFFHFFSIHMNFIISHDSKEFILLPKKPVKNLDQCWFRNLNSKKMILLLPLHWTTDKPTPNKGLFSLIVSRKTKINSVFSKPKLILWQLNIQFNVEFVFKLLIFKLNTWSVDHKVFFCLETVRDSNFEKHLKLRRILVVDNWWILFVVL